MTANIAFKWCFAALLCSALVTAGSCSRHETKELVSLAQNAREAATVPDGVVADHIVPPANLPVGKPVEKTEVKPHSPVATKANNKDVSKDDVVPQIDIARDVVAGEWRFRKGTLVAPDSANARIMLPCSVPPQYRVRMVVERLAGTNGCGIGLVAGGRQLVVHCDSPYKNKRTTGLALVGGEREYENETAYEGLLLRTHHPVEIVANVTQSGVTVTIDGKEIIRFMNGYHRIQIPEELVVPDKGKLFLFADRCPCLIESVEVTALSEDVNLSAAESKPVPRSAPSTTPPLPASPPPEAPAVPTPSAFPSPETPPVPTPSAFPNPVTSSDQAAAAQPEPEPAPASSAVPAPAPPARPASSGSSLRTEKVDERGRLPTTTVRLDDFVDVAVDEFGDQYEAYEFLPPVVADDWEPRDSRRKGPSPTDPRLETVLDQADARKGNFQLAHIFAMDIDPEGKTLFWTNRTEHTQHAGTSYRAAIDHSDSRLLARDLELSMGMTADHEHKRAYVTMREKDLAKGWTVRRVDFEGLHNGKALTGFSGLRALAVDPKRGFLYACDDKNRIFQSDLDGGSPKVLAAKAGGMDLAFDANRQKLYYSYQGTSLSVCDVTTGEVTNIFGDELYPTDRYLWRLEGMTGLSLHPDGTTLYFRQGGTEIFRCGVNGSRIQQLVCGSHRGDHVVLADRKGEYLYFPEMANTTCIRRIPIPPPPQTVVKPAPPLVTGYQPSRGKTGDVISIHGRFFQDIQEVAMIGLSTGDYMKAKYEVVSPERINLTVPALPHVCDRLAVVVLGSSGVTVTMPFDSLTVDQQRHRAIGAKLDFDSYATNQRYSVVANQKTSIVQLGRAVAYGSWDSYLSAGTEGRCAFFVKNHATTSCLNFHDGIIFHEPFAIIHARHKLEQDSRIVPVSAIRPSFVNSLFEFDRGSPVP